MRGSDDATASCLPIAVQSRLASVSHARQKFVPARERVAVQRHDGGLLVHDPDRAALLRGRLAEPAGPLPVVVASRVRRHRLGVAAEDLPQPDGRQPAESERLDARTEGDRRLGP